MADTPPEGDPNPRGLTRRSLFRSAGVAAAAGALLRPVRALAHDGADSDPALGPGPTPVRVVVNGTERKLSVEPRRTLLDALRTDLDLTGSKRVCDRGTCGACTVWLDGEPVYACMVLALEADGRAVTTVEGLGTPAAMHPVQQAFVDQDALQCGFCTPGLVMACAASVARHGKGLTEETLRHDLAGNLCRCGTYPHVLAAGMQAAAATTPPEPDGGEGGGR